MIDQLLFLGRRVTNVYNPEHEAKVEKEDEDTGKKEEASTDYVEQKGYTMMTMTPEHVHYGQLPRSVLDEQVGTHSLCASFLFPSAV